MSDLDYWFTRLIAFLDRHQVKFFLFTVVAVVVLTIWEWR